MSASPTQRPHVPGGVMTVGGLSVGAGFFATTSEALTLILLGAAIVLGFQYIVRR